MNNNEDELYKLEDVSYDGIYPDFERRLGYYKFKEL